MQVILKNEPLSAISAELTVLFLTKESLETSEYKEKLSKTGFKAEQDEFCILHESALAVCGIEGYDAASLRSAAAAVITKVKTFNYSSLKVAQYFLNNVAALVEGFVMGGYSFRMYKSKPKPVALKEVIFSNDNFNSDAFDFKTLEKDFNDALIVATATNFTRELVNTTPQDLTPATMTVIAEDLASDNGLDCYILDENALEEEKMEAILAVGRASAHPPRLIHLAYKPKNAEKCVTLVGKGLTYDSGGLSLKPATSMVTMKMDKAGACAVLGMMKAVSELKLPVEVHGFIGTAENMIDGSSYKPDDVLKARNGTTIEVRNTDAEGRLVLADVLSYAQDKVKSDYLFDYATLTGACMVALGPYTTGMMGHSDQLKHDLFKATSDSGELLGTLPFNDHLKKLIKSDIADVCNIGSKPYGGAITAALFLDHFITEEMKQKWMHFDIAGPAYTESPWDVYEHGATGAGVRMTVKFLYSLIEK
ncbi:leucyl aminopeptidase [Sulfurimonas sp. HSL3-7]|uniref:leucyl aminopeptidase n=1 Tax=Sulfonitrofixus jiaomeiensis TaxID=3131938 RepID=UPI0031FA3C4D